MSAVIVANTLPAQIVALGEETLDQAAGLIAEASAIQVQDAASLEAGNALFRRIDTLKKGIEKQRLEITRPIDALKDAIIAAERQATKPLELARLDLGGRIHDTAQRLEAERREAERKAREEAEAKARAERERLEAERQEQIRKQQEAHAAAMEQARREAYMFGEEPAEVPAEPEPPPAVVVPVVEAKVEHAAPIKSAVRTTKRQVLRIVDASQIPRQIQGIDLLVPDTKAIEKLMKAGLAIPGCALDTVEGFASAGGR